MMISMMTTTSILRSRAPLTAIRRRHAGRVVFDLLFARGARSTTDKSPAVLLTVCGNACTRTRGRAHANFSWAPLVGGKGGETTGRRAGDPFNTLHPFSPSIFKISNVFSPSRRRHTARPGVYVHLLTIVRRRTSLVFSKLNNYNENN